MRQSRSADPWSSFLAPESAPPGADRAPTGFTGTPRETPAEHQELTADSRAVLKFIADRSATPLDEVSSRCGIGLLEVADAVRQLTERGLVRVREIDGRETLEAAGHEPEA